MHITNVPKFAFAPWVLHVAYPSVYPRAYLSDLEILVHIWLTKSYFVLIIFILKYKKNEFKVM